MTGVSIGSVMFTSENGKGTMGLIFGIVDQQYCGSVGVPTVVSFYNVSVAAVLNSTSIGFIAG